MSVNFNSIPSTKTGPLTSASSLLNVEAILMGIQVPLQKLSPEETNARKAQYKVELNRAYGLVVEGLSRGSDNKTYLSLLSNIMTKYGRLRYEEAYPACMVMMRGSLNAQFAALNIFNRLSFNVEQCATLEQLEESLFDHSKSSAFDDFMLQSDMSAIAGMVDDKNLTIDNLMRIGFTLSWYANGLLNTSEFKTIDARNNLRLEQVYTLCEKVLQSTDCGGANLEIAEMYYNGMRALEFRKDPKNIEGAHKWLDKAMQLNTDLEMAARVANLKSCDWVGVDSVKSRQFLDEAIRIRQSFPIAEQNPFLVANLQNRKAGSLLKEDKLEEAEQAVNLALEHAEAVRGPRGPMTDLLISKNNSHQYYGAYDLTKAKIKLAQGQPLVALKYVNRALETFEFHKQASADLIQAASDLKKLIQAAL